MSAKAPPRQRPTRDVPTGSGKSQDPSYRGFEFFGVPVKGVGPTRKNRGRISVGEPCDRRSFLTVPSTWCLVYKNRVVAAFSGRFPHPQNNTSSHSLSNLLSSTPRPDSYEIILNTFSYKFTFR